MNQKREPQKGKNESKDWGVLLLVVALFIFAASLFVGKGRDSSENSSVGNGPASMAEQKKNLLRSVGHHLKDVHLRESIQRESLQVESSNAAAIDSTHVNGANGDESVIPLVMDQENPGQKVLEDTAGKTDSKSRTQTPSARIAAKVERDRWTEEYRKRQEEEYARQFIENARQHGVGVRLNKNLDVTGIETFPVEEPIRIPQSVQGGSR